MLDKVVLWLPLINVPLLEEGSDVAVTGRKHHRVIKLELLSTWCVVDASLVTVGVELCIAAQPCTHCLVESRHSVNKKTCDELPGPRPSQYHQMERTQAAGLITDTMMNAGEV